MNKSKKFLFSVLFMAVVLLAGIGSMSVMAENGNDADALDDVQVYSEEESSTPVSGCDLKRENLVKITVKDHGFSMLAPDGVLTSLDTPKENFDNLGYSRPYFIQQGYLLQVYTTNENFCAVSLTMSDLDSIMEYYGDYSRLSKAQQQELVEDLTAEGADGVEFVKINGQTYLKSVANETSESDVYTQYTFTTVINGVRYDIYIQCANATDSDRAVINDMIKSIKLSGRFNAPSVLEIVLIVIVVLLAAAVALAYFFLFRVNEFVKSGAEGFALIGFDLPARAVEDDDDLDDDDSDEIEDDDDVKTAGDASEESEAVEEATNIVDDSEDDDDERIIKD